MILLITICGIKSERAKKRSFKQWVLVCSDVSASAHNNMHVLRSQFPVKKKALSLNWSWSLCATQWQLILKWTEISFPYNKVCLLPLLLHARAAATKLRLITVYQPLFVSEKIWTVMSTDSCMVEPFTYCWWQPVALCPECSCFLSTFLFCIISADPTSSPDCPGSFYHDGFIVAVVAAIVFLISAVYFCYKWKGNIQYTTHNYKIGPLNLSQVSVLCLVSWIKVSYYLFLPIGAVYLIYFLIIMGTCISVRDYTDVSVCWCQVIGESCKWKQNNPCTLTPCHKVLVLSDYQHKQYWK